MGDALGALRKGTLANTTFPATSTAALQRSSGQPMRGWWAERRLLTICLMASSLQKRNACGGRW
jgi:hypothetical protein